MRAPISRERNRTPPTSVIIVLLLEPDIRESPVKVRTGLSTKQRRRNKRTCLAVGYTPPRPAADEDPPPPLGCTPSVAAGCAELQATSRGVPGARHRTRLPAAPPGAPSPLDVPRHHQGVPCARVEGALQPPPPGRAMRGESRVRCHRRGASCTRIEDAPPPPERVVRRLPKRVVRTDRGCAAG